MKERDRNGRGKDGGGTERKEWRGKGEKGGKEGGRERDEWRKESREMNYANIHYQRMLNQYLIHKLHVAYTSTGWHGNSKIEKQVWRCSSLVPRQSENNIKARVATKNTPTRSSPLRKADLVSGWEATHCSRARALHTRFDCWA